MTKIFLTSDQHFFHRHILEYCPDRIKPLGSSLDDMHYALIKRHNCMVLNDDDLVYIAGDFTFKKSELLAQLRGTKILVRGNHDSTDICNWLFRKGIVSAVVDGITARINRRPVFITHIPVEDWPGRESGTIMFHGHRHGGLSDRGDGWVNMTPNCYDVGVDVARHRFAPIPIDKAFSYVDKKNARLLEQDT